MRTTVGENLMLCTGAKTKSFPMRLPPPALPQPSWSELHICSQGKNRRDTFRLDERDVRLRSNSVNGSEKPQHGRRAAKFAPRPSLPELTRNSCMLATINRASI